MNNVRNLVSYSVVGAVIALTSSFASADPAKSVDATCPQKLGALGVKDVTLLDFYCDGKPVDYDCAAREIESGAPQSDSLAKCSFVAQDTTLANEQEMVAHCSADDVRSGVCMENSFQNADQDVLVVKNTVRVDNETGEKVPVKDLQVWRKSNVILAGTLIVAMNIQKPFIAGPFLSKDKVLGHGLGNAFSSSVSGWLLGRCNLGTLSIATSALREEYKITHGYYGEWNSVLWDGVGITAGGPICKFLESHVARPEFVQEFVNRILGPNSSVTLMPSKQPIQLQKQF